MFYCKEYKLIKVSAPEYGKLLFVADDRTEWQMDMRGFYSTYDINSTYRNFLKWKSVIKKSMIVKLWTVKLTKLAGLQVMIDGKWNDAWYSGN